MQRRKQTAIDVTVAVAKSESFVRHVTRKFCKNKKVFRMKDFFCTHFSIRIVFLTTHAWKQEFPHPRSSQYLLQKYLKCFTVYSTSAHYRHANRMKAFFCTHFFNTYCFFDNTRLETRVSTHTLFTISVAKMFEVFYRIFHFCTLPLRLSGKHLATKTAQNLSGVEKAVLYCEYKF